jgi:RNA binding exosome subunit
MGDKYGWVEEAINPLHFSQEAKDECDTKWAHLLAEARKEERKRILEACGKQVEEERAIYGTDKHGLNLNDLTEIIYPDK